MKRGALGCLLIAGVIIGVLVLLTVLGSRGSPSTDRIAAQDSTLRSDGGAPSVQRAVARRAAAQGPPPPGYEQNLIWAVTYAAASKQQNRIPTIIWQKGSVGVIDKPCRIVQVIAPDTLLVDQLDSHDLPVEGRRFFISGMATSSAVDGEKCSLNGIVVVNTGTQAYTTVLGATRTVHALTAR